jgi:hypothetical protein
MKDAAGSRGSTSVRTSKASASEKRSQVSRQITHCCSSPSTEAIAGSSACRKP